MIYEYLTENRKYYFANPTHYSESENTFTLIVGKNGTGKSSLLRSLIERVIKSEGSEHSFESDHSVSGLKGFTGQLKFNRPPTKIIAASTSPFDKFPIPKRNTIVANYSYLGLRDGNSNNIGLAYIAKIINSLIYSIACNPEKARSIVEVLKYLGYSAFIQARFHLSATPNRMREVFLSEDPIEAFLKLLDSMQFRHIDRSFYFDKDGNAQEDHIMETLRMFERTSTAINKPRIEVVITGRGVEFTNQPPPNDREFHFLLRSGLLRLRDVVLKKIGEDKGIRINEASSGEQSVVMGILGIASQIKNGSLICIDEPEICLHPEWQEKYIELLSTTFQGYRSCQFIIATHSPQIVSNLSGKNCYVMHMETGHVNDSTLFSNRSADFQLARVFKSPGHRNEYLTRISINLFSRAAKNKAFDLPDRETLKELNENLPFLQIDDPVYDLIKAINEMFIKYG